jgi:hypothetical protein
MQRVTDSTRTVTAQTQLDRRNEIEFKDFEGCPAIYFRGKVVAYAIESEITLQPIKLQKSAARALAHFLTKRSKGF